MVRVALPLCVSWLLLASCYSPTRPLVTVFQAPECQAVRTAYERNRHGALPRQAILAQVNATIGDIVRCYEQHLRVSSAPSEGRMVAHFIVEADGRIGAACASPSFDDTVSECVTRSLRESVVLPSPGGNVLVSFPFTFRRSVRP